MSEKRFIISKNTGERFPTGIIDVERQTHLWVVEVVDLLNEQQSTIDKLDQENADLLGARIKAQEEWEKCTDKLKEKIVEQQSLITALEKEHKRAENQIKLQKLEAKK